MRLWCCLCRQQGSLLRVGREWKLYTSVHTYTLEKDKELERDMSGGSGGLRNCHMCLSEGRLPNKCHFPSGLSLFLTITQTMTLYFMRERGTKER